MKKALYDAEYEADREWMKSFILRERNDKKPESLKIGFLGAECYDIVILLARKCAEFVGKIALVDLSRSKNIGRIFSDYYREIDIFDFFETKELEEYELIFFYIADGTCPAVRFDEIFCVAGMNIEDVIQLKASLPLEMKRFSIVLRDYVDGKYSSEYLKEDIRKRIGYEGIIEMAEVLKLSAEDVLARSLLSREGDVNEKALSKDFQLFINKLYRKICREIRYRGNVGDSIIC